MSHAFDPARLRLSQDFRATAGVEEVPTALPVRKPDREWFVRTHRDPEYHLSTGVIELRVGRQEQGFYLVDPALWEALAGEPTFSYRMLILSINRQGDPFLWPVRLPRPDGRIDPWSSSAREAAGVAAGRWIRLLADHTAGRYRVLEAKVDLPEPEWPPVPMKEILRRAFGDRFIRSADHPVLRRLRGEI